MSSSERDQWEAWYESNQNRVAHGLAYMEQNPGNEPLAAQKAKRFNGRVNISVTSYIHRDRDPDGTSLKYLIDSLVTNSILANDTAKDIGEITQRQEKVRNKDEERTEIIITEI